MYALLAVTAPLLILLLITIYLHRHKIEIGDDGYGGYDNYNLASWIYSILVGLSLVIIMINNLVQISDQKKRFVTIHMLENQKEIYVERADTLLSDMKNILIEEYPQYEKEIFGDMTPKDLQMLFIKYPDVKNALVSMNYTDKLQNLKDDIYSKEIEIERVKKEINFRYINPWIFGQLLPTKVDILVK